MTKLEIDSAMASAEESARTLSMNPIFAGEVWSVNVITDRKTKKVGSVGVRCNTKPEALHSWLYTPVAFYRDGERIEV